MGELSYVVDTAGVGNDNGTEGVETIGAAAGGLEEVEVEVEVEVEEAGVGEDNPPK